jgi:hypothetical protein
MEQQNSETVQNTNSVLFFRGWPRSEDGLHFICTELGHPRYQLGQTYAVTRTLDGSFYVSPVITRQESLELESEE